VLKFNPTANITAHHGNIKDEQFGVEYFKTFDLVMNALDNLEARRHVNRLCVALDIPLVESGTQGYLGQVTPIFAHHSECFECQPKPTPKTFAVCTLRHTPDKPVHCIEWAKHIFALLFGPPDDESIVVELKVEFKTGVDEQQAASEYAASVYDRLFDDDIAASLQNEDRWKNRQKPQTLPRKKLVATSKCNVYRGRDQQVLDEADTAAVFVRTVERIALERHAEIGDMSFDKDDELAMDFVASAANLRMYNFHIPAQSRFQAKGIAGNIVHAIATTNAICASLIVAQGIHILSERKDRCCNTWIRRTGPRVLQPESLNKPNPACFVCSSQALTLRVNVGTFTLQKLYTTVLIGSLGMVDPAIDVVNRRYFILVCFCALIVLSTHLFVCYHELTCLVCHFLVLSCLVMFLCFYMFHYVSQQLS
jgi:ubiquitin-like 1-activating enzyme E1 B